MLAVWVSSKYIVESSIPQAMYHIPLDRAPAVALGRPLPKEDSSRRARPELDTGRVEPEREDGDVVDPKTERFRGEKNKPNRCEVQ